MLKAENTPNKTVFHEKIIIFAMIIFLPFFEIGAPAVHESIPY